MNNSCDSCFDGAKFKNLDYEEVKKKAKAYAVETSQDMVLYKEADAWHYVAIAYALANGIIFSEVVSQY